MAANSPHAVAILALGVLLLAAFYASPVSAGDDFGEMVVAHAAGDAGARETAPASAMWQRRVEDAVAPEFPSAAVRGPPGRGVGYSTFNSNRQVCINNCAAKGPGASYTRPCTYRELCRH